MGYHHPFEKREGCGNPPYPSHGPWAGWGVKRDEALGDLLLIGQPGGYWNCSMAGLPHAEPERRSPRLRLAEVTPIVLRCQDGRRVCGKLQCVSLTGGLVAPSSLLPPGALVRLLFVTPKGPVAGTAEMLQPVSWGEQPFRFAALPKSDHHRLRALIQPSRSAGPTAR